MRNKDIMLMKERPTNMKKLFALLLALVLVLSLAACGGGDDDKTPSNDDPPASGQQQEQNTPDPAPAPDNPDSSKDENSGEDEQKDVPVPTTGLPLDWTDNDHTKLVPAPDCGGKVLTSGEIGTMFTIELKWDMEQGLTYAQLLEDAGFGDDCVEKYEKQGYLDRTANGVNVQLMDLFGTTSLSIMPAPDSDTQQQGGDLIDLSGFLGTKTGKFYSRFADGRMYMEYETEMEGMAMTVISASNGDRTYSETKMDGASLGVNIMVGEDMYTIDHTSKMVIKMSLGASAQNIAGAVLEESDVDMGGFQTGTREIDGKTYDTEELIVEGASAIYCFDGDDLAYIISSFEGQEAVMKIVKTTDKVDDSLFEIPEDYTLMEL